VSGVVQEDAMIFAQRLSSAKIRRGIAVTLAHLLSIVATTATSLESVVPE
jgi:hypothetical protein